MGVGHLRDQTFRTGVYYDKVYHNLRGGGRRTKRQTNATVNGGAESAKPFQGSTHGDDLLCLGRGCP